jgi:hypothetical protein
MQRARVFDVAVGVLPAKICIWSSDQLPVSTLVVRDVGLDLVIEVSQLVCKVTSALFLNGNTTGFFGVGCCTSAFSGTLPVHFLNAGIYLIIGDVT